MPRDDRISEREVAALVKAYNDHKAGAVVVEMGPTETSASSGGPVVRLQVTRNETTEYEKVPEINMANANAAMVLEMLAKHGLPVSPDDLAGEFSVDDYWTAKGLITEEAMRAQERPPSTEKGMDAFQRALGVDVPEPEGPLSPWEQKEREEEQGRGPTVHDQGMTLERVQRYFSGLDQVAQWIHDNQLPDRIISFG